MINDEISEEKILSYSGDKCTFIPKTNRGLDCHFENFCIQCNICLAENMEFEIHSNLHVECKTHQCNFVSTNSYNLRDHVVQTHPKNQIPCTKCDSVQGCEKELMIHFNINHRENTKADEKFVKAATFKEEQQGVKNINDEPPTYIYGQCGENFVNEKKCVEHMESHLFKCYQCEYTCENTEKLAYHENNTHKLLSNHKTSEVEQKQVQKGIHQELAKCEYCGESFLAI